MEQNLVSVLMTAYNRESYIANAIESVLSSSYQNWELIIVDDGSKDHTIEIARSFEAKDSRIKVYINEKNLGDYQNRNIAASYARGKYIKYLDSDDIIYPHGLEVMVDAMEKYPEAGLGLPYTQWTTLKPYPFMINPNVALKDHFFRSNFLAFGPSAIIYNRDFFNQLGGFEVKYKVAADFAFTLKAVCIRPLVVFQRDLIWWRMHDLQEINTKEMEYVEVYFSCLKDHLLSKFCPLNLEESKIIIANSKKINTRKAIMSFVMLKIPKAIKIIKHFELNLYDFAKILLRNKRLKTNRI